MKAQKIFCFFLLVPALAQAGRMDCTQLEGPGHNVGVADNGRLYVTTNRGAQNLPLASQKGNVDRYKHKGFSCDDEYTATKEAGKVSNLKIVSTCMWGLEGPEISYDLGHDDQGCYVKSIVKDTTLVYEVELCEKLVKMQNQFGPDAARCNDLLSQMSKTLNDYQNSIEKKGLTMAYGKARDSYQAALDQTAECRRRLAFSSQKQAAQTGSAPSKSATGAK